jgi:hypothetical protein
MRRFNFSSLSGIASGSEVVPPPYCVTIYIKLPVGSNCYWSGEQIASRVRTWAQSCTFAKCLPFQ